MTTYKWYGFEEYSDAKEIRTRVFHEEQGFSLEGEFDETDKTALHIVCYLDGQPVGTGRIFRDKTEGDVWHVGRVAILGRFRGLHLGAGMMTAMEEKIREQGGRQAVLSAQVRVKGFYASLGYSPRGGEYDDEHCPHQDMVKNL